MKRLATFAVLFAIAIAWGFAKYRAAALQVDSAAHNKAILHLFAMSDYFPDEVIKDFEHKYNCEVRYDNFSSNEELLAKLQAGATGYDVIVPSDYMVRALIAGKLIRELDRTKLPNFKNIAKDFIDVPYDSGGKFSVPYTWGTTGLAYNTKFIKEPIDSWQALFDKKYSGHISLLDDEREVLGAMLQKLGYSTNTTNKTELEAAQKVLLKLKPSVRLFASDPKQQLLSGDIWIAQIYSGDAEQVMKTNPDVRYVTPKEGGVIWIDTFAVPVKAQNPDLAYAWINNVLDPAVGALITQKLMYSSPNTAAEVLIADERLRASHIRRIPVGNLEFLKDLGGDSEQWDRLWTEAKSQ
jgi:spermidine/putrescine transport system substrate-binding protein